MSRYMKRFIFASLFYLGLATIIGILDGTINLGYMGSFAHTHFNLLGFMAMIVFGIGYFILPRFNGTDLRWESWVPVHFWLANLSLIGMVVFRGLYLDTASGTFNVLFIIAASLQAVSIFLFVVNIWVTLTPPKQASATGAGSSPSTKAIIDVGPDTRVAELVDRFPSLKQTLVSGGLKPLEMPGHIDKVRAMGVTLGNAARNHGLDLDSLVADINGELSRLGAGNGSSAASLSSFSQVTASTLIGQVLQEYPQTKSVFQRHFGSGCFECPGQAYESVDMACRMHGIDTEVFLGEISEVVK